MSKVLLTVSLLVCNKYTSQATAGLLATPNMSVQTSYHMNHTRRLDCDAAFLFVFPRVGEPCLAGFRRRDDASLTHEGVGQRRLAVVDVRYHRHVTNVPLFVHDLTDLVDREVHLQRSIKNQ